MKISVLTHLCKAKSVFQKEKGMINSVFFQSQNYIGLKVSIGFSTKEVVHDLAERDLVKSWACGEEVLTVVEWRQLILLSLSIGVQPEIYSWGWT